MRTMAAKLNDVGVRVKIAISFAVMLALIGAMGAFATGRLADVNATTAEIDARWMPSLRYVGEMRYNMARHRAIVSRHVIAGDAAAKAQVAGRIQVALDAVLAPRAKYEPMVSTAEERANYAKFSEAWTAYADAVREMVAVSDTMDNEAAQSLYVGKVSKAGLAAESTVDRIVETTLAGSEALHRSGDAIYANARRMVMLSIALAIVLAIGAAWFLIRTVAAPVAGMTAAMTKLAASEMDTGIPALGRGDEIGRMARAVEVFKQNMIAAAEARTREEAERATAERRAETIDRATADFDAGVSQVLGSFARAADEMQTTASAMGEIAEGSSTRANAVAAAAEESAVNVQMVAAAAEELSAATAEINRRVGQSAAMSGQAVEQVRKTDGDVQSLAEAAGQIGEIVRTITEIAGQTRLLALNATIEAARAGEQGRGFAVVAAEVKDLAGKTASATELISRKVAAIESAVGKSVEAIRGIGGVIGEMNEQATAIAAAVEQQGVATNEIARNVQQVAVGTQDVTSNIAGVSQAAGETGRAAAKVTESVDGMSRQSDLLRSQVERFLSAIKAA